MIMCVGESERLLPPNPASNMKDDLEDESRHSVSENVAASPVLQGTIDPVYEAKAHTLNGAIQNIGGYLQDSTGNY